QAREKVEVLEDVADRAPSHPRPIRARDGREIDTVDEHPAAARLLEGAGDRQQRALAGAAWAHHSDELAPHDRQINCAERVHLARTGAVDLRYLAQFECACHCETSIVRIGSGATSTRGAAAGEGGCFRRTSAASSQRTIASSRNSSASATSASGTSSAAASALIRV